MSEEQIKSSYIHNTEDNLFLLNKNINFKNNKDKHTNNSRYTLNIFSRNQNFLFFLIISFFMINYSLCANELAVNLEMEFQKISSSYPSNWENYFNEIKSKGQLKLDKFHTKDLDKRLMKIHRFNEEVTNKIRTIVWEEYTIFKTFSFSLGDSQTAFSEFVGAARVIKNWVEIAYIEVESKAYLKQLTRSYIKRECYQKITKHCEDKIVVVPRGYTLEELEILHQTLKAHSYEYLYKQTKDLLSVLTTKEFVLSENSRYYSDNGLFYLIIQEDGNMVVYEEKSEEDDKPVWASGTYHAGKRPFLLVIETDGNMVYYDANWVEIWFTLTAGEGNGPFGLNLRDDGILTLIDNDSKIMWKSRNIE